MAAMQGNLGEGRRGYQEPREQAASTSRQHQWPVWPSLALPCHLSPGSGLRGAGQCGQPQMSALLSLAHTSPRVKVRPLESGLRAAPADFSPAATVAGAKKRSKVRAVHPPPPSPGKGILPDAKRHRIPLKRRVDHQNALPAPHCSFSRLANCVPGTAESRVSCLSSP